jgi:hypothetical protein
LPRPSSSPGQLDLFPAQVLAELPSSAQVSIRSSSVVSPLADGRRRSA